MITVHSFNTKIAEFETLEAVAQDFKPSPFTQGLQDFTFIDTDTNTIIPWTKITKAQVEFENKKQEWAKSVINFYLDGDDNYVTIPK